MSTSNVGLLPGKRHRVAAILAVAGVAAVVAVLAVTSLFFGTRSALASGSSGSGGGGGGCFATTGPVCTFKNTMANANFGSVSSDGCIFTNAAIQSFQTLSRPGNTATQSVFVSVFKFDACNNVELEAATNVDPSTGTPDFTGTAQFGTKLSTATVTGTASMFDLNSGTLVFTATINVAWQGFGPTTTSIDSSHVRGPGFILNTHFRGSSRAAEAAGTFTDETGTNLATAPTLNAELDDARGGTVVITRS